jgi:putative glutamine amidotransferase
MKKPIIGITTNNGVTSLGYPAVILQMAYVNAILKANGIPVIISSGLSEDGLLELFPKLDGVLFTGGGDISISLTKGQDHPTISNVDKERDTLEFALMKAAIRYEKPFLGICRGFQVLNIVLGGTLFSHIPSQRPASIKHDYYPDHPRNYLAHQVEIIGNSRIKSILKSSLIDVNSLHHQGVQSLGGGLNAVGYAPDGLIEAIEIPDHKYGIGVQWHPECLEEQFLMQELFTFLIAASGGRNL